MEKSKATSPPPPRRRPLDSPQRPRKRSSHPSPGKSPRWIKRAYDLSTSDDSYNKREGGSEEQPLPRPPLYTNKINDLYDPYDYVPTMEEWALAIVNANWKDEMERLGTPYETNHLGLEELKIWGEYLITKKEKERLRLKIQSEDEEHSRGDDEGIDHENQH